MPNRLVPPRTALSIRRVAANGKQENRSQEQMSEKVLDSAPRRSNWLATAVESNDKSALGGRSNASLVSNAETSKRSAAFQALARNGSRTIATPRAETAAMTEET